MQKIRVVLDTNLWISFLISRKYQVLDKLFTSDQLTLLFSERLIEEFVEVALRPKLQKYFQYQDVENILFHFEAFGEKVEVLRKVDLCRDEKDNFLIELALDGKADYLITGDADLLILNEIEGVKVLTFSDFSAITQNI